MTPAEAFELAYHHTIGIEGGYANDPVDRGGETFMGISRKHHPDWPGWNIVDSHFAAGGSIEALEENEFLAGQVKNFYRVKYWNAIHLNDIAGFSWRVAVELFDSGINCGPARAAKWLQMAANLVGRSNPLVVDGVIGPKTLAFVATVAADFEGGLVKTLNGLQFEHYHAILKSDFSQKRFFRGWMRRVWEDYK